MSRVRRITARLTISLKQCGGCDSGDHIGVSDITGFRSDMLSYTSLGGMLDFDRIIGECVNVRHVLKIIVL
jgi:hypothetical protein